MRHSITSWCRPWSSHSELLFWPEFQSYYQSTFYRNNLFRQQEKFILPSRLMPGSLHLSFFVFRQSCQWSYQNQLSFSGKDSTADFFKMTKNENQNMGWKAQKWHFDWNYGWQKSFSFGFLKIGCPFFKNIKKWLCSTKLRNDCVPLNWALRNDLCSPKLRNDCVPLN